jgi:cysteine desulfurase/selenocysteine lyase
MRVDHAAATVWQNEWFEINGAAYLNIAAQAPMPRVSLDAVQIALDAKRYPHHKRDTVWFELTNRLRDSLARLIGGNADDVALTTGASPGLMHVAHGVTWTPGDEILTARGEFPMQYATWKPMEARDGIVLTVVAPRDRFLTAEDLIAAMTPRTKVVSVSHVRFDDGSLLDAPRVAAACHAQGALFVLDVTQSCGSLPIDVTALGADVLVCSGYKWLLSPYGTGFCWISRACRQQLRPAPFYWMGQDVDQFSALNFVDPAPAQSARRFDAAETASYFNLNLTAMEASARFICRVGPETVLEHNRNLIAGLFQHLPTGCTPASPLEPAHRGAYGCFVAETPARTLALHQRLLNERIFVSLRRGAIRVSPHLYNTDHDIERLTTVVGEFLDTHRSRRDDH